MIVVMLSGLILVKRTSSIPEFGVDNPQLASSENTCMMCDCEHRLCVSNALFDSGVVVRNPVTFGIDCL